MDIIIHARNMRLSAAQRDRAEKRVASSLDRFESRLRRVLVVIEDVNGPRGGADKRCRIRATGGPRPPTSRRPLRSTARPTPSGAT
jgi:putative sigma-54 modulation protein